MMMHRTFSIAASLLLALSLFTLNESAEGASILPPAKTCFSDANGEPLGGGSVGFYIPSTTSPKTTWQDANQGVANTNPVLLDSAGCAVIYGTGVYRQIVKDSFGSTVWDQQTSDTFSSLQLWGSISGGSANAQTVTINSFTGQDGFPAGFRAGFSNSGPTTLNGIPVLLDSASGPVALKGGEIVAGNVITAVYSTADSSWHLTASTQPAAAGVIYVPPGGRLTLQTGVPVLTAQVLNATNIYYTPYIGNGITIYNGIRLVANTFNELTLALDANSGHVGYHQVGKLFDLFIIDDAGTIRLCSGPAWTSDTVRSATLSYLFGNLSNNAVMTCRYNNDVAGTLAVGAHRATYVGTFYASANGQTVYDPNDTVCVTVGPCVYSTLHPIIGFWNNYNRVSTFSYMTDNSGSYTYNAAPSLTIHQAHSAGITTGTATTLNKISYVQGLVSDSPAGLYRQRITTSAVAGADCHAGLGLDSTTAYYINFAFVIAATANATTLLSNVGYSFDSLAGFHTIYALENSDGVATTTCTYNATAAVIQLVIRF